MIQGDDTPDMDKGLNQRQLVHLMYALFAVGILSAGIFGAAVLAAVVLAYLKACSSTCSASWNGRDATSSPIANCAWPTV